MVFKSVTAWRLLSPGWSAFYASLLADLVSERLQVYEECVCSLLTLRAWFSTFMMSSSCCFFLARVSWSLAFTLFICTWYSITAGNSRRFKCYGCCKKPSENVIYTFVSLWGEERWHKCRGMMIWHNKTVKVYHKAARYSPSLAEQQGCLYFGLTNCT